MDYLIYFMMTLLGFVSLLLMAIILLQRGRGGGLAGAFGGAGGQSALGVKAGDLFTRITIGMAAVWFALAAICVLLMSRPLYKDGSRVERKPSDSAITNPLVKPADPEEPQSTTPVRTPAEGTTPAGNAPAADVKPTEEKSTVTPPASTPEVPVKETSTGDQTSAAKTDETKPVEASKEAAPAVTTPAEPATGTETPKAEEPKP
ncbi:preprotein translocase, SecG subunit [Planctopirus limnophila DSM 3776]|uniref:Protein-export membrane protein SecG n=1 Tax=Planctopirus limnophila (strain ATCC 43296 / DSM 3776 / IFAM 1008 / Mu 290) TaxID=521674 RepID=D5SYU6_PLAL2|nr:preprotein translocase subunit SecG [Planctopirus limnophila]ADG67878.1 preprotein translocase, SecG subunit [Planctopirus limnophila DSM 3776]